VKVDVALVGDLHAVLRELLPKVKSQDRHEWLAYIDRMKGDVAVRDIQNLPDNGHLYAAHVINDIWRETLGSDTIIVTDVGQHQMWEAQYFKHEEPRTLITSGGLAPWDLRCPRRLAVKAARPRQRFGPLSGWRLSNDHGGIGHDGARKTEGQHRHHQ